MKTKILLCCVFITACIINYCEAIDTKWENDVRITNNPDHKATSVSRCVVTDLSNIVHVVWHSQVPYYDPGINYTRSLDEGDTWEPAIQLTNKGISPSIAVDDYNRIHVAYNFDSDVYYKCSLDGGNTWQSEMRLTVDKFAVNPSVAADSNNRVHIVWYDSFNDSEIFYIRSINGGGSWENVIQFNVDEYDSYAPVIAADSKDRIHIVWQDDLV